MLRKKRIYSRLVYIVLIIFIVILLLIGLYYFGFAKEGFFFINAYDDLPSENEEDVAMVMTTVDAWLYGNSSGASQVDYAVVDPKIPYKNNTLSCLNGSTSKDVTSFIYIWYINNTAVRYQNTSTLTGTNFSTGQMISCGIIPQKTNGLMAYWSFDEKTGTTFYDWVGNNSGTSSLEDWQTGRKFSSVNISQYNNYTVDDSTSGKLIFTENFTYEFWVNQTQDINVEIYNYNTLFRIYVKSSKIRMGFPIEDDTSIERINSSANMKIGNWTQLVFVYNNSKLYLYIDGQLDTYTNLSGKVNITKGIISFGRNQINGNYFRGLIDEVAIYNNSLTAQEIEDHYYRGISILSKYTTTDQDTTSSDFGQGNHSQTTYHTDISKIILGNSSATAYYNSGEYTSRIYEYPNGYSNMFMKWTNQTENGGNLTIKIRSGISSHNETVTWSEYSGPDPCYADDSSIILGVPFSEGFGNKTKDIDNLYEINLSNNDFDASGKHGYGAYLYGFDSIKVPNDIAFKLSNVKNYTIELWVSPTTSSRMAILSKSTDYFMYINDSGNVVFNASYDSNSTTIASTSTISAGSWTHIMVTHDDQNLTKMYINGYLEKSQLTNGTIDTSNIRLFLGGVTGLNDFNGSLDSLVIYNRTLTASEAYNHGSDKFTNPQGENAGKGHRFVQYKVRFETNSTEKTPKLGYVFLRFENFSNYIYNDIPTKPVLSYPGNATTVETSVVSFNWSESSDLEQNTLGYELLIGNNSNFTQIFVSKLIINNFSEPDYEDDNNTILVENFDLKKDMIKHHWVGNWTDTFAPGWKGEGLSITAQGYSMSNADDLINEPMGTIEFMVYPYWNISDGNVNYFLEQSKGVMALNRTGSLMTLAMGRTNGSTLTYNISSWITGNWHHIAISWKQEKNLSLYVDGILANTTFTPDLSTDNSGVFYLGSNASSRSSNTIAGAIIDELRISNVVKESHQTLNKTYFNLSEFTDGTYYWKVRAVQTTYVQDQREGEKDYSAWSDTRTVLLDSKYPNLTTNNDLIKIYSLINTSINLTSSEIVYCEFRTKNTNYQPMGQTNGLSHNQTVNLTAFGQFTYYINCNDSSNKYANTTLTFYVFNESAGTVLKNTTQYSFVANQITDANLTYSNLGFARYSITTKNNVTGKISAVRHQRSHIPTPSSSSVGLPTQVVAFWTLVPDEQIVNNLTENATVYLRYYDSDIEDLSVMIFDLYYYDSTTDLWKKMSESCLKMDYNISFSTSTFGIFALGRTPTKTTTTNTATSTNGATKAAKAALAAKLLQRIANLREKMPFIGFHDKEEENATVTEETGWAKEEQEEEQPNEIITTMNQMAELIKETSWLGILFYVAIAGLGTFFVARIGLALVLAMKKEKVPYEELEEEAENIDSLKYYIYKNINNLNMDQELLNKGWDADEVMRIIKEVKKLDRGKFEDYIYRKLSDGQDEEDLIKKLVENKWDEKKIRREIEKFKRI